MKRKAFVRVWDFEAANLDLLNLQLPRPVVSVEYLNPFEYKDFKTDKIGLCRRGTDKRGRDRQKRTQLNSLVCPPVSHNAIRAMNLATLVTYSLNRYSLQASSAPKRKNLGSLSIQARLSGYDACMTSATALHQLLDSVGNCLSTEVASKLCELKVTDELQDQLDTWATQNSAGVCMLTIVSNTRRFYVH